jgi:hypothetical protein
MTASSKPDAEELIVRARFFANIDVEEDNLRKIKRELISILRQKGYRQADTDPIPWGPAHRTMEFYLYDGVPIEKGPSAIERVKGFLESGNNRERREISKEDFLRGLEEVRDDLPFQLIFHFKPHQDGDVEGYDIEIESVPALLQKHRQLPLKEKYEYDTKNVVDENKREVKRIMGKLGLEPVSGPAVEAKMEEEDRKMSSEPSNLFNQYNVTAQLQAIVESDAQIHQDYQKSVREFNEGEYEDAIRDVGRAGEALIELLCADLYERRWCRMVFIV